MEKDRDLQTDIQIFGTVYGWECTFFFQLNLQHCLQWDNIQIHRYRQFTYLALCRK